MRNKVHQLLGWLLAAIMAALVLTVLLQVAARYLSVSIPFTEELSTYLLIWVGLLGAGYATGGNKHLAIDLLYQKAGPVNQYRLLWVINAFVALFALLVMVIGGSRLVYIALSLNQLSPVMQIPKGYVYTVLPISGLLIIYFCVLNVIEKAAQTPSKID